MNAISSDIMYHIRKKKLFHNNIVHYIIWSTFHYIIYCSERPYAFVLHLCSLEFGVRFIGFLRHFKTKCTAVRTDRFVQQFLNNETTATS